jgi:hypothetical protein
MQSTGSIEVQTSERASRTSESEDAKFTFVWLLHEVGSGRRLVVQSKNALHLRPSRGLSAETTDKSESATTSSLI